MTLHRGGGQTPPTNNYILGVAELVGLEAPPPSNVRKTLVRGAHSASAMAAPGSRLQAPDVKLSTNFSFQVEPTSVDARGACKDGGGYAAATG